MLKYRGAYFLWCSCNKPRSGIVHELMKKSRARFKYAQNQVLKNEKLYVQMHWHQSLLMAISNVSGKKSINITPATWLTVTE